MKHVLALVVSVSLIATTAIETGGRLPSVAPERNLVKRPLDIAQGEV
jgi:hypothetical protein